MTFLLSQKINFLSLFLLLFLYLPANSFAQTLTKNTLWQGEITVTEDLLVPKGVTLTIKAGTNIRVVPSESTKTDPEYVSPLTEITVRGILKIEGVEKSPVEFSVVDSKSGSWAGIVLDDGVAVIHSCRIRNADTALYIMNGRAEVYDSTFTDNRYGLVAHGNLADLKIEHSRVTANEYGVFTLQGAKFTSTDTLVSGNRKNDNYSASVKPFAPSLLVATSELPVSRRYGDEVFRGDTIWQGRIEIAGVVRVPEGSRLFILPGTIVEFLKKDTTGTGIGENGLMIQGRLIAKGTKENPIIFRSAEKVKKAGDWDSINIMNSAGTQNLIENCRIENAYRGLHFHFSHVGLYNSTLTNNYRGIQFQESLVVFKGNQIYGNKSGMQGRDSDVTLNNNEISGNSIGANFYRVNLTAVENRIVQNSKEGMRIREGVSSLRENLIDNNRFGLMVADMFYGDYSRNIITNNLEIGISLKNADNVEVIGNFVSANGFNGINIQESRAVIVGNQISDNGERGIGVQTFDGEISGNNFIKNKLFAIDLEGPQNLNATNNWWGKDEPSKVVYDKRNDPLRGVVLTDNSASSPFPFVWQLQNISANVIWRGLLVIPRQVIIQLENQLTIAPATIVEFSEGSGMLVKGRLIAVGDIKNRIRFTSHKKKVAGSWDEIQLEYATGSKISNCIFEYATWGIHSHFTNLLVENSHFINNYGGMRFRSGPAQIRGSIFENNEIGIRAYIGNAVISGNIIKNNETGIFVREKGGGLVIKGNNIHDNNNYAIRVGDFNNEDVNARGNWWGEADIKSVIFDAKNEPGIGNVLFEPILKEPVKLNLETLK